MPIKFYCTNQSCCIHKNEYQFYLIENCPNCHQKMSINWVNLNPLFKHVITNLPVHVARPVYELCASNSFFKKLHLISDSLMGILRLNGLLLKTIYLEQGGDSEELDDIFATLDKKESHGLWSYMASKVVSFLDRSTDISFLDDLMMLYGVKSSLRRMKKIKRLTVNSKYTDWKGQNQSIQITNTPLELLINFRNKYLGHGTVFSEDESKRIYNLYEPIFIELLSQCEFFTTLSLIDANSRNDINGYDNNLSDDIIIKSQEGQTFNIKNTSQLRYKQTSLISTGNYNCSEKSCEFYKKKYGFPTVQDCPACSNPLQLSSKQLIDKEDQKIIETYPYFLAHPYQKALTEPEPYKRIHLLKETFLNYLKYLGLITASEYFNSDLKVKEINRNFKQFLFRPQFGYWNAFMRETVKSLTKNKHQWFVKELPTYYQNIETDKKAKKYNNNTGIGALINFRNHYLGHGMVPTRDTCEALWTENFAILKQLFLEMDFCKNYTIISKDRNLSLRLMGNKITQFNPKIELFSNVAMMNDKNEQISIVPFLVLPGEYFIKEVSEHAKLMVYEQNTGKRMVFFSPESISGETSGNVLEQLNMMICEQDRDKPINSKVLTKETFQKLIKESNKDFIGGLISERKVIPGIYQERQDAEIALRSWIGALAGLFFVSAEAGSGKTNLLVEMNRQYNEREIDTILLRGNRFVSDALWEEIRFRLNLAKDVDLSKSKAFDYSQDKPLMILIDGCNEHPNADKLFDDIVEFLNIHKGGHIKVVLSWRVNTKSELPSVKSEYELLVYQGSSESNAEKNIIEKACHWLKPLNKKELEGAWDMYTSNKKDKIKRKPNFTFEELTYKDRSLADQLENPLLMRLFLEMYNGKGLPKSKGGFTSIWTLYHQKIISL